MAKANETTPKTDETLVTGLPVDNAAEPAQAADLATTSSEEENFLLADVTVEDRSFGPQYPIVQWVNGDPTKKREGGIAYTGGFFFSNDQGIKIAGAVPYTLVTKDGEDVEGYAIRDLTGVVIRYRRGWMATPKDGLPSRFANSEYDEAVAYGKVRGQTHVVFEPDGCSDLVMLTFRGLGSKAIAGMGKEAGAIPQFGARVVGLANRLARQSKRTTTYPLCAFKLTIGPARLDDGAPAFTEVGKKPDTSQVTFPVWADAPMGEQTAADVQKRYVGHDRFNRLQVAFSDTESWVEDWSEEKLLARRTKGAKGGAAAAAGATAGLPGASEVPF